MNPFVFLIDTLFYLYILLLMLRLLLQWAKADFYNPLSQFIVKLTNPPVIPLRRIIPGYWGIDFATLVLVLLLTAIKLAVVAMINGVDPAALSFLGISVAAVFETIDLILSIFLFAIFIQAILSWINPDPYNPVMSVLGSLTRPVLTPFRKMIPPISGIDISPIFAIIAIMFIKQSLHYLF